MTTFDEAYKILEKYEGVYSNDKKDPGGETYAGISRKYHPDWNGWKVLDNYKQALGKALTAKNIPIEVKWGLAPRVKQFYRTEFWDKAGCNTIEEFAPSVATELFEASVNTGISRGVMFLQKAVNRLSGNGTRWTVIATDGVFGNKTYRAVEKCCKRPGYEELLVNCQNGEQYMYYVGLSAHADFPGWFARV